MIEVEHIILDATAGDLFLQVDAAIAAMKAGIEEGGLYGFGNHGKFFTVSRNETSIRVRAHQKGE